MSPSVPGDRQRAPYGRAFREFLATEIGSGVVLLAAVVVALAWANSPWQSAYERLWHTRLEIGVGSATIAEDLRHWLNDGLMVFFFLVVGLEIKRELVRGELNSARKAIVPSFAALGGMILPALIYLAINRSGEASHGWGIPMATDIAFALGVLALVASRAAPQLRVLLLSLAIVDDIGAIIVIAAFYSGAVTWPALGIAALISLGIFVLHRLHVRWSPLFVVAGFGLWLAVFQSGIHATIAGVVMGLLTPIGRADDAQSISGTERLEHVLHRWSSFVILPLFALANAGISLGARDLRVAATSAVALGIVAGMVAGKTLGISGFTLLARRFGGELPSDVRGDDLAGMSALGGIGFTLSLFIASLAFTDPALIQEAKIGILAGSVLSAVVGIVVLRFRPH